MGTLYASTHNDVYSWPYSASSPGPLDGNTRRTLITNMTNSGHMTRTLLLSRSRPGTLFVSRGSASNKDSKAKDLASGHSQIRSFNISCLNDGDGPYDFLDGHVWGWGLRNSVGVAEDPVHGGIWSVENSADQLHRDGRDIHTDNPGEELNFHGFTDGTADGFILGKTGEGNNYGYPVCHAVWSTDNFPHLGNLVTGDQFLEDDRGEMTDKSCNKDYIAPVLTFQAHTAPLDIKFTKDGSEAFISFHGSCKCRPLTSWAAAPRPLADIFMQGTAKIPSAIRSRPFPFTPTASPWHPAIAARPPLTSSPRPTLVNARTTASVPSVLHGTRKAACGSAPTPRGRFSSWSALLGRVALAVTAARGVTRVLARSCSLRWQSRWELS